ncbi:MAG: 30S ribosomal protein S6 [Alphaproteobacteria bacterium]|nr:30S ribosomal protein S6 [Alphaproteobacteria bacterium]
MPFYEHVFIARQDISSTQVDGLVEAFTGLIENDGGKIVNTEYWGLKNLAYRIKKNRKGHYVMLNIESPADAINELERNERLHEDVLRYLTLRVDELEEGPSVMARGRKERSGRDRDENYRAPDTGDEPKTAAAASDDKPAAETKETVEESKE